MALDSKVTATPQGRRRRATPVVVAASVGAVLLCFELYLLLAWIGGPNFQEVSSGPSEPPTWMKIAIRSTEVACVLLAAALIHRFVVRPWRRERRVPFDGLLVLAALGTSLYDPLNSYFHNWFAYNSYFVNYGTAMVEVPGWQSYNQPGEQIAWPIFFIPPLYAAMFLGVVAFGCFLLRWSSARWPQLPTAGQLLICFAAMFVGDAALEGPVVMRLGFYDHTGWSLAFLDSHYGHNALKNIVFVAVCLTATSWLRFHRNDRGETLVERGSSRLGDTGLKANGVRFLAVYAAMQAILFFGYHAPVAIGTQLQPDNPWHENMVENSFLNDHLCGVGTPRDCPPN
jgi:hypothetical protein